MDLFCEKHQEKMVREGAHCRHPQEYCKFRTACLLHFIGKEEAAARGDKASELGRPGE